MARAQHKGQEGGGGSLGEAVRGGAGEVQQGQRARQPLLLVLYMPQACV